jgi:hypothetical protein
MKFAVVEYSSKTGKIWRHTPQRPNYLCDPVKEIDPTSFGCYVSALEGVHIPLTAYITGEEANVSPLTVFWRKVVKRLTGAWPNYAIDAFSAYDALLVVYQISDGHEVTAFTRKLKKTFPNIVVIGVPTQPYGLLKEYWEKHPALLEDLKTFMAACDVFLTIVASTKDAWQSLTTTPVHYLPQPYPVEYALEAFVSQTAKRPVIYVAGVTSRPIISRGYEVARKLTELFPEYTIEATADGENEAADVQLVSFKPWREQLDYLASVKLVINTDYTQTRGRVQMDCAVVGTPSLGSDSDAQLDLFAELAATPETSLEVLVEHGKKLLSDAAYYDSVVQQAKNMLGTYTYEECAKRVEKVLREIKI